MRDGGEVRQQIARGCGAIMSDRRKKRSTCEVDMSRVNLGMGGSKKKSSPKKKAMKSKGSAQGVKMKSKGGAMGGKKEMMPGGMKNGGGVKPKGMKNGGKMATKGYRMGGKVGMAPPPKMTPGTGGASRPMPSAAPGTTKTRPTSPKAALDDRRNKEANKNKE